MLKGLIFFFFFFTEFLLFGGFTVYTRKPKQLRINLKYKPKKLQ